MAEGVVDERRSSAEIIAVSSEIRERMNARTEERRTSKTKATKKSKDQDMEDAKRELVMHEHKIEGAELMAELTTDFELGMTTANADKRRQEEGLNMLTPPKQVSQWILLFREMTGFFAILLWLGAILCFLSYGLQKQADNLYLGIVLAFVTLATGFFSFFQNRKSSNYDVDCHS